MDADIWINNNTMQRLITFLVFMMLLATWALA